MNYVQSTMCGEKTHSPKNWIETNIIQVAAAKIGIDGIESSSPFHVMYIDAN